MTKWAVPKHPKSQVNWAGDYIARTPRKSDGTVDFDEVTRAFDIISNWRSSHAFPLNTMQNGLRKKAYAVDLNHIVAQRIKRLSSIMLKLRRFKTMTLSQMQDIGGCRAIVTNLKQVHQLVKRYEETQAKHKLKRKDDYIATPRSSGYRGVHMIYSYFSDKKADYNSLQIEMQLRTQLQHAWATAVEVVGTLISQALKASQGEQEWLRFFALMGTAFAHREETAPVPDTPSKRSDLKAEIRDLVERLDLINRLQTYGTAINVISERETDDYFFLLALNAAKNEVRIRGFKYPESDLANAEYTKTEQEIKDIPGAEAVLVSVSSVDGLRKAYPNFFLDTKAFIELVREAMGGTRQKKDRKQLQLF